MECNGIYVLYLISLMVIKIVAFKDSGRRQFVTQLADRGINARLVQVLARHKHLRKATLLSHKAGQHAPGNLNIIVSNRRFLSVIDGRDNRQSYRDQAAMADQKPFLNLQHFMDFLRLATISTDHLYQQYDST